MLQHIARVNLLCCIKQREIQAQQVIPFVMPLQYLFILGCHNPPTIKRNKLLSCSRHFLIVMQYNKVSEDLKDKKIDNFNEFIFKWIFYFKFMTNYNH